MSIDAVAAVSAEIPSFEARWGPDDVILYHLGLGAGSRGPNDLTELRYTFEGDLHVLPSFGTIPAFPALELMHHAPGIVIDRTQELHGEHELVVHQQVPAEAVVVNIPRIAAVWDKKTAAVIVLDVQTQLHDGSPLFTNRFTVFARGQGGFGGDPGPQLADVVQTRAPDHVEHISTLIHQNLIYRLSGDKHPLHVDPGFAKQSGFPGPILAGLCTFGIACKAVVDRLLDGNVTLVKSYRARFAGVVLPGETVVIRMWREERTIHLAATTLERGAEVLSRAVMELR